MKKSDQELGTCDNCEKEARTVMLVPETAFSTELCHKCIIERTIPQPNTDQECKSIYCVCPKALMSGGICYSCNKEVYRSPQPNTGDVTGIFGTKKSESKTYSHIASIEEILAIPIVKDHISKLLANQRQEDAAKYTALINSLGPMIRQEIVEIVELLINHLDNLEEHEAPREYILKRLRGILDSLTDKNCEKEKE